MSPLLSSENQDLVLTDDRLVQQGFYPYERTVDGKVAEKIEWHRREDLISQVGVDDHIL